MSVLASLPFTALVFVVRSVILNTCILQDDLYLHKPLSGQGARFLFSRLVR